MKIPQTLKYQILDLSMIYGAAMKTNVPMVAHQAIGDWRFFDRLVSDDDFTRGEPELLVAWLSDNWKPECGQWPSWMARPWRVPS